MSQASISGFTFIRNGVELGFPFEASIRSLLPLVDEFVVVVGKSNDDTLARIHAIGSPKIRVIEIYYVPKKEIVIHGLPLITHEIQADC